MTPAEAPSAPRGIAEEPARMLAAPAEDKGAAFVPWVDPRCPDLASAAATALRQIVLDLARDAIGFTGIGRVAIPVA